MSPSEKFYGLLASVTVTIMFFLVINLTNLINSAAIDYPWLLSVGALISSAGMYRILSLGIRWLMERWGWLKGLILGPYYMHGTWIGCFYGHGNDKRYIIEHFTQDMDSLVITGRSFTESKQEHGHWESGSTTIDTRKGRLIYTYTFDVLRQTSPLEGIHSSLLERKSAHHAPSSMSGFAHDLNDDFRVAVNSIKISNSLLPWDQALRLAEANFGGHL